MATASSSDCWALPPSWRDALPPGLMESDQLQRLRTALSAERASADVLPRPEETFAAFEACT